MFKRKRDTLNNWHKMCQWKGIRPYFITVEAQRPHMVSALNSGSGGPGSSPGRGHCVVFLGKTLYSHSASLHPGVQMGTSKCAGGNPAMD